MTAPLEINDVMGSWSVQGAAAGRGCTLSLSGFGETSHRRALAENCAGSPFDRARNWRLAGETFELLDEGDVVIVRFRQTGVDAFGSIAGASGEGSWSLTRAPLA